MVESVLTTSFTASFSLDTLQLVFDQMDKVISYGYKPSYNVILYNYNYLPL